MWRMSSLDHLSASWGLRGGGESAREPPAAPLAEPASDVEDTSTGESLSYSARGGEGDPEADAVASTNFSGNIEEDVSWSFVTHFLGKLKKKKLSQIYL